MEIQLTWLTKVIFLHLGGNAIEKEAPVTSFARRSKFLRRAFKSIPLLVDLKNDAISVLDRADKLADTRHDLTHAVITHMRPISGKYQMQRLKLDKKAAHTLSDVVFDIRHFPKLSRELVELAGDAIRLSLRFQDKFGIKD